MLQEFKAAANDEIERSVEDLNNLVSERIDRVSSDAFEVIQSANEMLQTKFSKWQKDYQELKEKF